MAVAQIRILSEEDIEKVHERSLEMLANPGVAVHSERALKLLEGGGAKIDWKEMRASIPENLVEETVKNLPKSMRFGARDPNQDMIYPREGPAYMATNGTAVYMTDLDTGERNTTTGADLRDFMVLCDAMDSLDYVWPTVTAHDAPDENHALSELTICLLNTTKHVQGEAMSADEAKAQVEVAARIAGGEDALAKRPLFSVIQCPICPLEFEKGSIEATMEFAKAGIPVVSMSMALMGLTSPVSIASTVAIVNAENLASFAISQLSKKGAPVVYSSESTSPNMMTGEIHYGALEELLLAAAAAQMADHYGAASMVGGFGVGLGGESPGIHLDPAELIFTTMTSATGTDFASGIGGLDQAKGASLEQIIIDCDLWESVREVRRIVPFDDPHFALDLVRSVGPGGTFLKERHTVKNMKKELFIQSRDKARNTALYQLNRDRKEVVRSARERVKTILATHKPQEVDGETRVAVDRILAKHQSL
jgi:trimethylamine--corrinoid protein Co-methyltransferase